MEDLFSGFLPRTKAEWLAKIEKDLKGKPLDSLTWNLSSDIAVSPFAHAEDIDAQLAPLVQNRLTNSWETGVWIKVDDYKTANQEALLALENGANALCFSLETTPNKQELSVLLQAVQHEWISTNFVIHQPAWERITSNFAAIIREKGQNPAQIACSFAFEGNAINDIDQFNELLEIFPKGRFLTVNAQNFYQGNEKVVEELAATLTAANNLLIQMNDAQIDIAKAHSTIQFSMTLGDSYFLNIAKIRALKLLWQHILTAWDERMVADSPIEIHLTATTQTADENYNKIKATTQSMSAIIGGASRLFVHAADEFKDGKGSAFEQRIALNIQHILQLESYLDRVVDPSAGSYYIENLTNQLAEKTWKMING